MHAKQLCHTLNLLNSSGCLFPSQKTGHLIDYLLQFSHFSYLSSLYGRQYIFLHIQHKLLSSYILRKRMKLIDQNNYYVLISGKVNCNGINIGDKINVDEIGYIEAEEDCMFVKVRCQCEINNNKNNIGMKRKSNHQKQIQMVNTKQLIKSFKLIKQYEQQIIKRTKSLQLKLHLQQSQQQQHQSNSLPKLHLIQILSKIQPFSSLPYPDLLHLLFHSSYFILPKSSYTHQQQSQLSFMKYIIQGQIKVITKYQKKQYSFNIDNNKSLGNKIIEEYKIKKNKKEKNWSEVIMVYGKGEWVGVGEYMKRVKKMKGQMNNNSKKYKQYSYQQQSISQQQQQQQHDLQQFHTKSYSIVNSIQSKLLYIPLQIFQKHFNPFLNNRSCEKLKYLTSIKQNLLNKKIKSQNQKQSQLLKWSNDKLVFSPQLVKKIGKYQIGNEEKGGNINIQDQENYNRQKQQKRGKLSLSLLNKQRSQQKLKPVPSKVVHLIKQQQFKSIKSTHNTNKLINQRINLFPLQYSTQLILPSQRKQLQIASQHCNTNMYMYMQPKSHRKACQNYKNSPNNIKNSSLLGTQRKKSLSIQQSYYYLTQKAVESFNKISTFYNYKDVNNKANINGNVNGSSKNELNNLNYKTISMIENEKKSLYSIKSKSKRNSLVGYGQYLNNHNNNNNNNIKSNNTIDFIDNHSTSVGLPILVRKKTSNITFIPLNAIHHNNTNNQQLSLSNPNNINNLQLLKKIYKMNISSNNQIGINNEEQKNYDDINMTMINSERIKEKNIFDNYRKTLFVDINKKKQKEKAKKKSIQNQNLFYNTISNKSKQKIQNKIDKIKGLNRTASILNIQS